MSGAKVSLTLDAADALARLGWFARRGGALRPLMDQIGNYLANETRLRFETGRGPSGAQWTPSIRAAAGAGKTLVERGHLRDSITHSAGHDRVEVGSNVVYAAIHQFGGRISAKAGGRLIFQVGGAFAQKASVEIPARPYLGLSQGDEAEIGALVEEYLLGAAA